MNDDLNSIHSKLFTLQCALLDMKLRHLAEDVNYISNVLQTEIDRIESNEPTS